MQHLTKRQLSDCTRIAKRLNTRQGYEFWSAMKETMRVARLPAKYNGQHHGIEDVSDEAWALYVRNCALDAVKEGRKLGPRCSPPEGLEAKMLINRIGEGDISNLLKVFLNLNKGKRG